MPGRIDSGPQSHCCKSPSDYFPQQYFEVIDTLIYEDSKKVFTAVFLHT